MSTENKNNFSKRCSHIPSSFIRDILKVASQKDVISFAGGLPDPHLFPLQEIQKCTFDVFQSHGAEVLQYGKSEGLPVLKEWICSYYLEQFDMEVKPEEVLITSGSQQALDLIGKAFIDPGDQVMLEQPSYLGAIQAFSAYQPVMIPLKSFPDGPDLESLKALLVKSRPKLLYLVSNFQNPTGFSISNAKRRALASLSEEYGFNIVEDDPYGMLRFKGDLKPPIRSSSRNTILCGSFSKVIAPGLRIGWVVANQPIIQQLVILKQASDLHANYLSQYIIADLLKSFSFQNHIDKIKLAYQTKGEVMYKAIKENFPTECKVTSPEGGMFLWVELPEEIDAEMVLGSALSKGVLFVPGKYFYTNGNGKNTMRLNFTNCSEESINKGIALIGDAIKALYKQKHIGTLI